MKGDRLFEMLYILLNRGQMTARELADHFEVSVRTIYRDVDTLAGASIPIYAQKGKGGGIRLLEGFSLHEMVLSPEEKEAIRSSLTSLRGLGDNSSEELLKRLGILFNQEGNSWLEVDLLPWGDDGRGKDIFNMCKEAILKGRLLSFAYLNNRGEAGGRVVAPLRLIFKARAFYLLGVSRGEQREKFFKLSRMRDVFILDEVFRPLTGIEAASDYTVEKETFLVKLWIDKSLGYRVYDEFSEKEVSVNKDGSFQVDKAIDDDSWWLTYFLSFGSGLKILSPLKWQKLLVEEIRKMGEIYS